MEDYDPFKVWYTKVMKQCTKCKVLQEDLNYHKDKAKKDNLCPVCKTCKIKAVIEYYRQNTEIISKKKKAKYEINKEEILLKRRKYLDITGQGTYNKLYPNHFDFGKSLRKEKGVSNYNRILRQYKKQAKYRNLDFNLLDEDFRRLITSNCYYCGVIPLQIMKAKESNGEFIYNGIDRKDNTLGYILENCVSCCGTCNTAKSNLSFDAWRNWINRIIKHNS